MALEFNKIDETCSNVYLIDERLCLKNSFEIINTNVVSLSTNLNSLQTYCNQYNQLYSNFSSNSARWIRAISNFQTLSAGWFSAETTVKTLSSYWYRDLHVIYNKIINLTTYYTNQTTQTTYQNEIKDWLTLNFISNLVNEQVINVDLYLSKKEIFNWIYYKTYYENCVPQNQIKPASGCSCTKPDFNCNHVRVNGAEQLDGACTNAAAYCDLKSATIVGNANINCPNQGNTDVTVQYNESSDDKSLTRVITLKYKRVDDTIIKI